MQNRHLMATRAKNNIKTLLMLFGMGVSILIIGYGVTAYTGNSSYIMYALILAVFSNIISYFFSDKIALMSSGAVPADVEKYRELHQIVEELSGKNDLPKPKVYIINDPAPNAFATGRNDKNSAMAFTTGLLATLNRGELEGVISHELSHIKNKDILIMTVVVVMATVLSSLGNLSLQASMFGGSKEKENNTLLMIVGMISVILMPIAVMIIQSSISRKREFAADSSGALLTGHPEGLASALQKIGSFRQPLQRANDATAHLYISSPFGGLEYQGFFQKLFNTHPPIEERIAALEGK